MAVLLVGIGGFIGANSRYLLGGAVHQITGSASFPYGTVVANVLGCLVIGILGGLSDSRQVFGPEARAFLFIGILGGFTTFSTFGYETINLLRDGRFVSAVLNVSIQLIFGLPAVFAGYTATKAL